MDIRTLVEQVGGSAIVTAIVPLELDAKFVTELGVAVMLDKPIIAMIRPGTEIPRKLAAVVDSFIEYHPNDIGGMAIALQDALVELGFVGAPESPT